MTHRWRRMSLILLVLFLPGCAFDKFTPPPVSPALIANSRYDHADAPTLSHGRTLFVSRCLECHTLPPVTNTLATSGHISLAECRTAPICPHPINPPSLPTCAQRRLQATNLSS